MYIISGILTVGLLAAIYAVRNLLLKVEQLEDEIETRDSYLQKLNEIIDVSAERIRLIDERGTFASDDEVGFFFSDLKIIQDYLTKWREGNHVETPQTPSSTPTPKPTYTFASVQEITDFVKDISLHGDEVKLIYMLEELGVSNMLKDWPSLSLSNKSTVFNNFIDLKTASLVK